MKTTVIQLARSATVVFLGISLLAWSAALADPDATPASTQPSANAPRTEPAGADAPIPPLPKSRIVSGRALGGLLRALTAGKVVTFEHVRAETAHLLRLKAVAGRLALDKAHWDRVAKATDIDGLAGQLIPDYGDPQDTEKYKKRFRERLKGPAYRVVFRRLKATAGATGGGYSSSGEYDEHLTFRGKGLRAGLAIRRQRVHLMLSEEELPYRQLEFWDGGTGGLRLVLSSLSDGAILSLRQQPNGRFSFSSTDANGAMTLLGASFAAACRTHPRYMAELGARLRKLGVRLPMEIDANAAQTASVSAPAVPDDPARDHWKDGLLQEVRKDTARLVALTVTDGRLSIDTGHWARHAAEANEQITPELAKSLTLLGTLTPRDRQFRNLRGWPARRTAAAKNACLAMRRHYVACATRWHRGGGGAGSGFGRTIQMDWSISGAFGSEMVIGKTEFRLSLSELREPHRGIGITEIGGARRLEVTEQDGAMRLLILQAADGRFSVADAIGADLFVASTESFAEFSRKYPKYTENRLLAYLDHLGIGTPPSPHSEAVVDAAMLKLTAPSEQDLPDGRRLVKELGADSFQRRQAATRGLTSKFTRYRKAVEEAMKNESLPEETKIRLRDVFDNAIAPERIEAVVSGLKLLDNVDYLIFLLDRGTGADRKAVAARLRKLTAKDFGDDPKVWRDWRSSGRRAPSPKP